MNEFWQSCIAHLEQEFPPQQISAWIRPLVPLAFDESGSQLRLAAPNRFKLDWVRKNFSHQIETFATSWFKRPVHLHLELSASSVERPKPSVEQTASSNTTYSTSTNSQAPPAASSTEDNATDATLSGLIDSRSRLNVELTFDNFVTGKANQLARAAA